MIPLSELIACPVCHGAVRVEAPTGSAPVHCERCGRQYRRIGETYSMVPAPPPESLADKWPLWEKLQENGLVSYELAPELNLSTSGDDPKAFGEFMQLHGLVLDVGCGPRDAMPAYAVSRSEFTYVGLDPLVGAQPRSFPFVHGLAEALPFRSGRFDHVVFATSIDHLLDYDLGLREAARVLRPGGRIHIMADVMPPAGVAQSRLFRMYDIGRRGFLQAVHGVRRLGFVRTTRYLISMARLRIPKGAMDYFHVYFPQADEIAGSLGSHGLVDIRRQRRNNWIFISARKPE